MPAQSSTLCVFLRVNQRFHAMVIRRVGLDQIHNVEFVCRTVPCILHSEVEPLGERLYRTVVKFKLQIVFKFAYLGSSVQITRLKS